MKNKYIKIKIYGIENLQKVFIYGFIYENFLIKNENKEFYILELKAKSKNNNEYYSILDIERVFFQNKEDLLNFEATELANLPVHKNLFHIMTPLSVETAQSVETTNTNFFQYGTKLLQKFENHSFEGLSINKKLGLYACIVYYLSLDKESIIKLLPCIYLFNIKEIDLEEFSKFNMNIFLNYNISKQSINYYKKNHGFDEISQFMHVILSFLEKKENKTNQKLYFKRISLLDDLQENLLSLIFKILSEVNEFSQDKNENYEYYMQNILQNLNLDFYEEKFLEYIKRKNFHDDNLSLIDYALLILIKGNYNMILNNPTPFKIKEESLEHINLICYVIKGISEGYGALENKIKIQAYETKLFNFILNHKTYNLRFYKDFIKIGNIILKNK